MAADATRTADAGRDGPFVSAALAGEALAGEAPANEAFIDRASNDRASNDRAVIVAAP